jgi:hypothetical protein
MTPGAYSFTLYQGSTFERTFTWLQSDGVTPVDLTGCSARAQGRSAGHSKVAPGGDPYFNLTDEADGGLTLGGVAGTIRMVISAELSSTLTFKLCEWDLEIEFPGGDPPVVQRLLEGKITMDFEVTK